MASVCLALESTCLAFRISSAAGNIFAGKKGDVKIVRTGPKQASVVADKVDMPWLNAEKITAKSINLGGSDLLNLIKTMQAKINALTATVEKLTAKTCLKGAADSIFWPKKTKTPSPLGVVLHTHKPDHMAYRIPASMFSTLPKGWFAKDGLVHFYCNGKCTDSGSPGGCTARDGGILGWPDDMDEDKSFRKCLLESVAKQGGVWKKDTFCGACLFWCIK